MYTTKRFEPIACATVLAQGRTNLREQEITRLEHQIAERQRKIEELYREMSSLAIKLTYFRTFGLD